MTRTSEKCGSRPRRPLRNSGQAMLIAVLFMLFLSTSVVVGAAVPILKQVRTSVSARKSIQSHAIAQSALEDVYYRLVKNKQVGSSGSLAAPLGLATTTVTSIPNGKRVIATSNVNGSVRRMQADIMLGDGISFYYGVQAGEGGFTMANSSSVTGNVYSNGPIVGTNSNWIYGDAASAGPSGAVRGIHATGTIYARAIGSASVSTAADKHAYYKTITNTSVAGTKYPNSTDLSTTTMPISDEQIEEWKAQAAAGGTMASTACSSYDAASNTCTITSSKTLGPIKIPFNLLIKSSSAVITVAGPIWVEGNITLQTGPTMRMAASLGSANVAVIADKPSDSRNSGIISVGQSSIFMGSGSPGSFVFMISQNNDAEMGGTKDAITLSQGASALVAYAAHGQATLSQSVSVKEVTAYRIALSQSANVKYDSGLPNTLFSSGPSGGYEIASWKEIP